MPRKGKPSRRKSANVKSGTAANEEQALSLTPLWIFLALAVAVFAWSATAPLETSFERGKRALVRAQKAISEEHWELAVQHTEAAQQLGLQLEADELNAYGVSLMKINRTQPAAVAFRRAIDLQPESFSALRNLAHVLRTTGQVEDAALLYGQLVELYDACEIHKSHGKRAETNANSSSTTNHMAKHTRPEVCDAMSKSIETKEGFQAAVREALFYGADILHTTLNRTQAAVHQLQRLVKIDPRSPRALLALAELLLSESAQVLQQELSESSAAESSEAGASVTNEKVAGEHTVVDKDAVQTTTTTTMETTTATATRATSTATATTESGDGKTSSKKWDMAASVHAQAVLLLRRCSELVDESKNDFEKQVAVLRCQWLFCDNAIRDAEAELATASGNAADSLDAKALLHEGLLALKSLSRTLEHVDADDLSTALSEDEQRKLRLLVARFSGPNGSEDGAE